MIASAAVLLALLNPHPVIKPKAPPKPVTIVQPAPAPVAVSPSPPPFDPNNPATWPTCSSDQVVWADDGQCHDKVVTTPVPVAAPAPVYDNSSNTSYTGSGDPNIDWIISHESGGNSYAINPATGACGLGQALTPSGCPYALGDVGAQLAWIEDYITTRYGTSANAKEFWVEHGWY